MQLKELKGIGEKTAGLLNKLSVDSVEDLIHFYPRNYDIYEKPVLAGDIHEHAEKPFIAVDGVVAGAIELKRAGNLQILSAVIKDEQGNGLKVTWFNMPYLKTKLRSGHRFIFRGRAAFKNNAYVLEQPVIYTFADYNKLLDEMQPIYALTKGLSNKIVTKAVLQALDHFVPEKDYLPDFLRKKYHLAEYNYAIKNIHFPKTKEDFIEARKRLVFEEFFFFILAVRKMKEHHIIQENTYIIHNTKKTDEFIEKLPYQLTNAQKTTWQEVKNNMESPKLMNRLIQGDVGSGKTIIAVLALMNTAFAGFQGAMMVPTEVLAKQQFDSVSNLFRQYGIPFQVSLLIGSMTAKEKNTEYEKIQSGETNIIIGTHALIQDKVEYHNLGLVITDEQHRFGVNQRDALAGKGYEPHVLVMSATPIPRTLAIILYGDLDISVIDEMPSSRIPVKNCVVGESYRSRAYKFIEEQVKEGRQAYIICPMVEESEMIEAENVVDYAKKLQRVFPKDIKIEYLHGKMKSSEKNEIMRRFSNGFIHVLVSTTVIEVGVNVPNAAVMMIENADRFGLAQLHQLRGRVGRGSFQSYCMFFSNSSNAKTKERLNILNKTNNGFVIAEEDMKLRGPGDFFGIRQSGIMEFALGDIFTDASILKEASDAANTIEQADVEAINEAETHDILHTKLDIYMETKFKKLII